MATNKGQFKKGISVSPETQFKKGQVAWNKGKKTYIICKKCNKTFNVAKSRERTAKFCSRICRKWKDKPKCLDCGKELSNYNNRWCVEHGRVIGEKNGKWIADRSKIKIGDRQLHDPLQKQWRREVKNRDKWKCMISDENCNGRLEAHHILPWSQYPELRYKTKNGITLCHYHHPRKSVEVAELAPVFQRMVSNFLVS